ncbi:Sodium:solute symporter family-domain-containing protein [Apiospora aurea]|uniref:Sodium:solute symporter family-domain-containing protein n=1 Tax=Apiospora aurea TaxID=335848 RepID=A0ABR1QTH9_9PEZI
MAFVSQVGALIPQGTAYGFLIGLGILFCAIILLAVKLQKAYLAEDSGTFEMFVVANRSVGTGLTPSAVFSSWMWINETVLAAAMCYRYGLAVPLGWGSGLCFQIALMAAQGVMAKIRVPYAHTSLEIIRMRYGNIAHVVFIVMNLGNNVFGCASMILTGSRACILSPLHCGRLKATFLTDFLHTAVALVLIIYFTLTVLSHSAVGGLGGLYDKVVATASENFIPGNYQGSLLTMKSYDGIIWGLILKFGNLTLVVMDTAFWQRPLATEVNATVPGYNLAALAVFGIPWGLGTVIGLTGRARHNTALFATYPGAVTDLDVSEGLIMYYVIKALIAVSSILSFDLYKTYLNPCATGQAARAREPLDCCYPWVRHHGRLVRPELRRRQYDVDRLLPPRALVPGHRTARPDPAVVRTDADGCHRLACPGFATGLAVWLGTAQALYGRVDMVTTGASLPALFGAIASFFSPAIYSVVISLSYRPCKFDWREFLQIELAEEAQIHPASTSPEIGQDSTEEEGSVAVPLKSEIADDTPTSCPQEKTENNVEKNAGETTSIDLGGSADKKEGTTSPRTYYSSKQPRKISIDDVQHPFDAETLASLHRWHRIAWVMWAAIVLVTFILWPMPLYRDYIFSRSFFSGWVSVAIVWQFFAFSVVVIYPLYDGRYEIAKSAVGLWRAVAVVLGKSDNQGRAVETK